MRKRSRQSVTQTQWLDVPMAFVPDASMLNEVPNTVPQAAEVERLKSEIAILRKDLVLASRPDVITYDNLRRLITSSIRDIEKSHPAWPHRPAAFAESLAKRVAGHLVGLARTTPKRARRYP